MTRAAGAGDGAVVGAWIFDSDYRRPAEVETLGRAVLVLAGLG